MNYEYIFALALIATAGFGVNKSTGSNVDLNELALKNVEALAEGEGGGECRWATRETSQGCEAICIDRGVGYECDCREVKEYYSIVT